MEWNRPPNDLCGVEEAKCPAGGFIPRYEGYAVKALLGPSTPHVGIEPKPVPPSGPIIRPCDVVLLVCALREQICDAR